MKVVQGGILAALVLIAGLLYSIKQNMAPRPAAPAEVTAAPATPAPAYDTAANLSAPQSFQAQKASPLPVYSNLAPAPRPAAAPRYQSIPRASSPAPARTAAPAYTEQAEAPAPAYTAPAPQPVVSAPPPPPPAPAAQTVTVAAGTAIAIRMLDGVSTERNRAGDTFQATLEEPLIADGVVVADRGASVMGRVVQADAAGRVAGVAQLALELDRVRTVAGETQIASDTMIRKGDTSKTRDAATVGTMAGIGAAIGAIAGGRRGAGIGAAAGGAGGAGTVMSTRGKPLEFEPESRLTFRLRAPVTVTVDPSRLRASGDRSERYDRTPAADDSGRPRLRHRQP